MFRIRSRVAAAVGFGALVTVAALTAVLPASSFADSPQYVALSNGTSAGPGNQQEVLDIRGASTERGAAAICFASQGGLIAGDFVNSPADNQLWELRPTGEKSNGADFVFIINKHSQQTLVGRFPDPFEPSLRANDVIQEPLFGDDFQKWLEFSPNGGHGVVFKNKATGRVLDASGANTNSTCNNSSEDFVSVVQAPENDNPSQLWFFLPE